MERLALILVGESIINSPIFCDEIREQIKESAPIEIEARYCEPSFEMYHLIEFLVQNPCEIIIICAPNLTPQLYEYLASLTPAPLEESDAKFSAFSLQSDRACLHFYALDECEAIPHFALLEHAKPLSLALMGIDKESAQLLLSSIAREYGYSLHAFSPFLGMDMLSAKAPNESTQNAENRERFLEEITLLFREKIFPLENLAQKVVDELKKRGKIVVTAESCTGGGIAQLLTRIPGSSEVFYGGVVSYDNSIKERWLGVKSETLRLYGAVSEPTIKEMLRGALRVLPKAHYALAISGIAGPSGGSVNKPVGTVFIGVCARESEPLTERIRFTGNRERIRQQASHYALYLLLRALMEA